ncbi:MAG: hypothetical protein H6741_10390 [Alphaproteobacteria bacterium]|nr:hypothetical protein [Alphaproteobacteria bacterium]
MHDRVLHVLGLMLLALGAAACGGEPAKACRHTDIRPTQDPERFRSFPAEELRSLYLPEALAEPEGDARVRARLDCSEWVYVDMNPPAASEEERRKNILHGYGYSVCVGSGPVQGWATYLREEIEGPGLWDFKLIRRGWPGFRTGWRLMFYESHGDYSMPHVLDARELRGPDGCEATLLLGAYEFEMPEGPTITELCREMGMLCRGA